jgi:hypothetical protein
MHDAKAMYEYCVIFPGPESAANTIRRDAASDPV